MSVTSLVAEYLLLLLRDFGPYATIPKNVSADITFATARRSFYVMGFWTKSRDVRVVVVVPLLKEAKCVQL